MSNAKHIVKPGDSLIDIAVSQYGAESYVFQLMADNALLTGIDEVLTPGQELNLNNDQIAQRESKMFGMVGLAKRANLTANEQVTVQEGESLADLAIAHYGDLSYIFQLLEDNPQFQAADSDPQPGDQVSIKRSLSKLKTDKDYQYVSLAGPRKPSAFSRIEVYEGQSILDLALQEYGDISAGIELLLNTDKDNIGAWLPPQTGTQLSTRKSRVYDAGTTTYFQNRNIRINTGRRSLIEGIGLCSSDGVLLVTIDNFILKASDQ